MRNAHGLLLHAHCDRMHYTCSYLVLSSTRAILRTRESAHHASALQTERNLIHPVSYNSDASAIIYPSAHIHPGTTHVGVILSIERPAIAVLTEGCLKETFKTRISFGGCLTIIRPHSINKTAFVQLRRR